jgi:DNA segregation ATPase FtsK/SpoIIIE-like protein
MPQTNAKRKKQKTKKLRTRTRTVAVPVEPAEQSGKTATIALAFLSALLAVSVISQIWNMLKEPGAEIDRGWFGLCLAKISNFELSLFGPFPLLLLFMVLASIIACLLAHRFKLSSPPFEHYALGFLLLYVFFSAMLAIAMPETLKATPLSFKMASREYAGYIGLFLSKKAIPPIFGQDTDGLFICCVLGIMSTSFCFGLRPSHILVFAKKLKLLLQKALYKLDFTRQLPKITMSARIPDTGDFAAIRLGSVKPAKGSPFGKAGKQDSTIITKESISEDYQQNPNEDTTLDAIERINMQLATAKDPLEIRRLRDELANYKRIKEINDWEDIKGNELKIEGLLGKAEQKAEAPPREPTEYAEPPELPEPTESTEITEPTKLPEPTEPTEYDEYRLPLIEEILPPVPEQTVDYTEEELHKIGKDIEESLGKFSVKCKVTGIMTGPVITRFEIEPGPGVKVSKFENLSDDLALVLATPVRVIPSIPGKSVVGIERPNRKPQTVFCREILESPKFTKDPKKLQVVLGKDIMGDAFVTDLTRTPHLLIAGQTGAGKSVCINVLLASLLFSKSPEEVRLILVDPKVVELAMYQNIPHLLHPVITSPEVAVQALKWLCVEMDRRYEVLATARVRNIEGFNDKFKAAELGVEVPEEERKLMPFIVVIIDELADLMMTAGKEIETSIARIAQKARAVGIHLVLATQRPSVNVITGVIKANLPSRISFKVASYIDSKTILDGVGAEKLLGRGDMLFRSNDNPALVRIHGAFLKDSEVEALANACSNQNVNFERVETFDLGDSEAGEEGKNAQVKSKDALFWDAARLGLEAGELSISTLQRRLSIGFARAGKIMDQLTAEGICGRPNGSKPRKVLMNEEMINNLEKG